MLGRKIAIPAVDGVNQSRGIAIAAHRFQVLHALARYGDVVRHSLQPGD
jgi:hypothetical protein